MNFDKTLVSELKYIKDIFDNQFLSDQNKDQIRSRIRDGYRVYMQKKESVDSGLMNVYIPRTAECFKHELITNFISNELGFPVTDLSENDEYFKVTVIIPDELIKKEIKPYYVDALDKPEDKKFGVDGFGVFLPNVKRCYFYADTEEECEEWIEKYKCN